MNSNYPPGVTESDFEETPCEVCGEMECECGERVHFAGYPLAGVDAVARMAQSLSYDDLPLW